MILSASGDFFLTACSFYCSIASYGSNCVLYFRVHRHMMCTNVSGNRYGAVRHLQDPARRSREAIDGYRWLRVFLSGLTHAVEFGEFYVSL